MKAKQVMKRPANKISVPLKVMKKPIAMKTTLKKPATEVAAPAHKDFKDEVQCVGPSGRVLCTRMEKLFWSCGQYRCGNHEVSIAPGKSFVLEVLEPG